MTLIDSRPGITAVLRQINDEHGYGIDIDDVTERLGPRIDQLVSAWVPEDQRPALVTRFREIYPGTAIGQALVLPGAREAIQAVRDRGGRVLVITGKFEPNARLHLQELRLDHDVLVGDLVGEGKAQTLREHQVSVYVGDHPGDMLAAQLAGCRAVGVRTAGVAEDTLVAAGAEVVLDTMEGFPGWLDEALPARGEAE